MNWCCKEISGPSSSIRHSKHRNSSSLETWFLYWSFFWCLNDKNENHDTFLFVQQIRRKLYEASFPRSSSHAPRPGDTDDCKLLHNSGDSAAEVLSVHCVWVCVRIRVSRWAAAVSWGTVSFLQLSWQSRRPASCLQGVTLDWVPPITTRLTCPGQFREQRASSLRGTCWAQYSHSHTSLKHQHVCYNVWSNQSADWLIVGL